MSDFWSKRKAAVAAEADAHLEAVALEDAAEREAAQAEMSDADLLEELGLPDPDQMDADGDFKSFMDSGVPARLKTRALRRLWRVNPVLANLDGLVDYGEDFTDSATVIENLQTAYQVGKGMTAHVEALARKAEEAERALTDADEVAEDAIGDEEVAASDEEAGTAIESELLPGTPAEGVDMAPSENAMASDIAYEDANVSSQDADVAILPPRRRMTFTFDDRRAG